MDCPRIRSNRRRAAYIIREVWRECRRAGMNMRERHAYSRQALAYFFTPWQLGG